MVGQNRPALGGVDKSAALPLAGRSSLEQRTEELGHQIIALPATKLWRIVRRNLRRSQRNEVAPLERTTPDLRTVAAPHVAFQFMDRRRLRSPHDVEGNGLMRVAAKPFHFEIAVGARIALQQHVSAVGHCKMISAARLRATLPRAAASVRR
jgi:hypothetical protein